MKREFKEFVTEVTDAGFEIALKTESFRKYNVYDPETLKELALVSKGLSIMGNMIEKIEKLEERIEKLENTWK